MKSYFNNQLQFIIAKYKINTLLISISGGQDSLCLIKIIENLKKNKVIYKVHYIYIDHQWNIKSKKQILHLINYIKQYKSQMTIYQIHNYALSESIARSNRYHILINYAIKNQYQYILTAHTQTDKIETFLYNLIRGTSIDGATSLIPHREIDSHLHIFRPFLLISRINTNWFCRKFCLPIWSDYSNYNLYIKRNRIRNELIPYLKNYFNINVENKIVNFLMLSNEDNEYIKQNSMKLYLKSRHKYFIALNYEQIKHQHITLKKRTLQLFFFHNFNINLSINYINQLIFKLDQCILDHIIKYKNLDIIIKQPWIYIK
uniref:tRNA(Ile)-lysidine synthase n=1 Tax=Ptilothamnion sphaericum TaxID=1498216 RepID=A0A4D6WYX9_9FLOR|nr:tRNA Ile-lysidine synthetase [Ptilothamnion sphaericum]